MNFIEIKMLNNFISLLLFSLIYLQDRSESIFFSFITYLDKNDQKSFFISFIEFKKSFIYIDYFK